MARARAEYRLSPAAAGDLDDIWVYTRNAWGIEQAHRYTDELAEALIQFGAKRDHNRLLNKEWALMRLARSIWRPDA